MILIAFRYLLEIVIRMVKIKWKIHKADCLNPKTFERLILEGVYVSSNICLTSKGLS